MVARLHPRPTPVRDLHRRAVPRTHPTFSLLLPEQLPHHPDRRQKPREFRTPPAHRLDLVARQLRIRISPLVPRIPPLVLTRPPLHLVTLVPLRSQQPIKEFLRVRPLLPPPHSSPPQHPPSPERSPSTSLLCYFETKKLIVAATTH